MKFISIILVFGLMVGTIAQASDSATELELDPIAYAFNGYSFHLGQYYGSWKFDIGAASENLNQSQTSSLLSNSNFTAKFVSYGAKIDYIGSTHVGWHIGIQWDYSKWTYTSTINSISTNNDVQTAGVRIGYRFGSGHFYFNPWIGFLTNYQGAGDINVGGQTYKQQSFQVFPTVHLGIRF